MNTLHKGDGDDDDDDNNNNKIPLLLDYTLLYSKMLTLLRTEHLTFSYNQDRGEEGSAKCPSANLRLNCLRHNTCVIWRVISTQ